MSRPDFTSPNVTALYGNQIPTKRRSFLLSQGQVSLVTFQFLDWQGNPVNLGPFMDCGSAGPQDLPGCVWNIEVRMREVISRGTSDIYTASCDVIDADQGLVTFIPPPFVANNAGVYGAEFGVTNVDSVPQYLAFTNKCSVWVDRGLFGDPACPNLGPPTVDEVRLFIRDNGPEENLLLDDLEFDLAEICQGTENAVRYWNEVNPPIDLTFTTITYCVRHKWLQAIAAHMLLVAAHRFRRNHLPYQAGGISVDDQNKFQQYEQAGQMLMAEYKEWVKTKKVQLNCEAAVTSTISPYSWSGYGHALMNMGV